MAFYKFMLTGLLGIGLGSLATAAPTDADGMERIPAKSIFKLGQDVEVKAHTKYVAFQNGDIVSQWENEGPHNTPPLTNGDIVCYFKVVPADSDRMFSPNGREIKVVNTQLLDLPEPDSAFVIPNGYYTEVILDSKALPTVGCSYLNDDHKKPTIGDMRNAFGDYLTLEFSTPVIVNP